MSFVFRNFVPIMIFTKQKWLLLCCVVLPAMAVLPACREKQTNSMEKEQMAEDGIVRLSKIEVYPQYREEYIGYAVEVGEISLTTEPGVLTMYAVADKDDPCHITILETYASREAYDRHIASDHFQKYKQGTLHMVKSLELTDVAPLNPASALTNSICR